MFKLLRSSGHHVSPGATVRINTKRIRKWLAELPAFSPVELVETLVSALEELDGLAINDKTRFEVLIAFRKRINGIFRAYDTVSFHNGVSTSNAREHIATGITQLHLGLSTGFNRIAAHGPAVNGRTMAHEPYLPAAYSAMEQLAYALIHTFRTRGHLPRGIHRGLNRLYALAEREGVLATPVKIAGRPAPATTVGQLFKRVMLLCIADPYGLVQKEVAKVFDHVGRYAEVSRIMRRPPESGAQWAFVLDLDANVPPVPLQQAPAPTTSTIRRILDVGPVLRAAARDQINEDVSPAHKVQAEHGKRLHEHILARLEPPQRDDGQNYADTVQMIPKTRRLSGIH